MKRTLSLFLALVIISLQYSCASKSAEQAPIILKALIIDGENNHGIWPKTTYMMRDYLEETGLFEVDVDRTAYTWQGPHHNVDVTDRKIEFLLDEYPIPGESPEAVAEPQPDPNYAPKFSNYDLIVSNFGWKASVWPVATQKALEEYMSSGGGLVVVHAADNSWQNWDAFNEMIGIGGWGGRTNGGDNYYVHYDGDELKKDATEGGCGSHGAQMEIVIKNRAPQHPIMKGIPDEWLHAKDELYQRLCGPANNITVLATAYSDEEGNSPPWNKEVKGSGMHEPILMALDYGKGRIFHSTLGHMDYSMECVGFITTFQRGAEWAATGKVTQAVPEDFPGKEKTSSRSWSNQK